MNASLLALLILPGVAEPAASSDRLAAAPSLAARIDDFVQKHWKSSGITPAAVVDDAAFLRRVTLDLAGRIPTHSEATQFAADRLPDRRGRLIQRLMTGPEYPLHLGRMLEEMIQEKHAGDAEFLEYLRSAVANHQPWDAIFRDIMLGPWDSGPRKGANRFLTRRLSSIDDVTNDTSRIFFGVDVSCAKCHDHPLVPDWTQDHYYGMASFLSRTVEGSKGKKNGEILEKDAGDVTYVTTMGERRTAKLMFLSNQVLDSRTSLGRREQLVQIALEEKHFFSRALVNRFWAAFMGQGLVQPVDQMHSANPPSVPGLLEWLADDFAGNGYDLDRLVAALVSSRVYQLASVAGPGADDSRPRDFAQAALRPLTPAQFALSLVLATGDGTHDRPGTPEERIKRYRLLEGEMKRLTGHGLFDQPSERFQSSAGEALFLSNSAEVQRLVQPTGNNLVARLIALPDSAQVVETAVWTILSRPPEAEERAFLVEWLDKRSADRPRAISQLTWALLTSAEFRFNH